MQIEPKIQVKKDTFFKRQVKAGTIFKKGGLQNSLAAYIAAGLVSFFVKNSDVLSSKNGLRAVKVLAVPFAIFVEIPNLIRALLNMKTFVSDNHFFFKIDNFKKIKIETKAGDEDEDGGEDEESLAEAEAEEARIEAEKEAKAKEAEKAKAREEARIQAEKEAKAKEAEEARIKAEEDAKAASKKEGDIPGGTNNPPIITTPTTTNSTPDTTSDKEGPEGRKSPSLSPSSAPV